MCGYKREIEAEKALTDFCENRNCFLVNTDPSIDMGYGVDFEIRHKETNKVVAAIQVKSYNFMMAMSRLDMTEIASYENHINKQHLKYIEDFHIKPDYLYIDDNYKIKNPEILSSISKRIDEFNQNYNENNAIVELYQLEKEKQKINQRQLEISKQIGFSVKSNSQEQADKKLVDWINSCLSSPSTARSSSNSSNVSR